MYKFRTMTDQRDPNGRLLARKRHGGKRTWLWHAPEPMASYLATVIVPPVRPGERS